MHDRSHNESCIERSLLGSRVRRIPGDTGNKITDAIE